MFVSDAPLLQSAAASEDPLLDPELPSLPLDPLSLPPVVPVDPVDDVSSPVLVSGSVDVVPSDVEAEVEVDGDDPLPVGDVVGPLDPVVPSPVVESPPVSSAGHPTIVNAAAPIES